MIYDVLIVCLVVTVTEYCDRTSFQAPSDSALETSKPFKKYYSYCTSIIGELKSMETRGIAYPKLANPILEYRLEF